jgi:hypothetical protein
MQQYMLEKAITNAINQTNLSDYAIQIILIKNA